jgi:hypothetical protein
VLAVLPVVARRMVLVVESRQRVATAARRLVLVAEPRQQVAAAWRLVLAVVEPRLRVAAGWRLVLEPPQRVAAAWRLVLEPPQRAAAAWRLVLLGVGPRQRVAAAPRTARVGSPRGLAPTQTRSRSVPRSTRRRRPPVRSRTAKDRRGSP